MLREGESPVAGRDPGCEVPLGDGRVSTRHAKFLWSGEGWDLVDLGSKNGTFLNGLRITEASLGSEDWVSFGGLPARFVVASDAQVSALSSERAARFATSAEIQLELEHEPDVNALLAHLVESALSVSGAERGFVVIRSAGGTLRAAADAHGSWNGHGDRFVGSRGAVERVLATGRPVVVSNAQTEAFLGKRPSVVELGLKALTCIPLHDGARVFGVLYLDGKSAGASFSELDVEILETLADRASILLASARLDVELRELADAALLSEIEKN